jgi:8-amino-7-oxononanoate synthase
MYGVEMLTGLMEAQKIQAPSMKNAPAFYRNLEQALDMRRAEHTLLTAKPCWDDSVADLTGSDFLSLNRSGRIRSAFMAELDRQADCMLGAGGSRTQYGNYSYINQVEAEIAAFHGAETAFIVHSGFLANVAVLSSVPLPGDAIVYDELVHASIHEGMAVNLVAHKVAFKHNDVDSLCDVLTALKEAHPAIKSGARSIIICVESIYSMDGDVCPLKEMVEVAKEVFPLGNAQFLMDEAHSTGIIGKNGVGLVSMLGLEKEVAIRLHVSSKALASTGGEIS